MSASSCKSDSSSLNDASSIQERLSENEMDEFDNDNVEMQAKHTIIFHPGSSHLRIGRASDSHPVMIPHVIAWRHKNPGDQPRKRMKLLPHHKILNMDVISQINNDITPNSQKNQSSQEHVAKENLNKKCEVLPESCGWTWTDTLHLPNYLIGDDALYIDEDDCYDLFWPIVNGQLNLHLRSLTAVLADLEAIWKKAIEFFLHIPMQETKDYKCVLLIPDIYNRVHVKHMIDVLLLKLNFSSIIIHQESVCASFGCGIANACVVDVGHHKTSICIVEDGVSHQSTQICLDYGGRNITHVFACLLQQNNFPYRTCNIQDRMDALLLEELKETFCHLDMDSVCPELHEFNLRRPGQMSLLYSILLGNESIQAPMGIFYPSLFVISEPHNHIHFYSSIGREYNDLYHDICLSKQNKTINWKKMSKQVNEDENLNETMDAKSKHSDIKNETKPSFDLNSLIGLDQAIVWSIENVPASLDIEDKRKLYNSILLVGGGISNFTGIETVLKSRIKAILQKTNSQMFADHIQIINKPKNLDPSIIAWRGGAVLACLYNARELWITTNEWTTFVVRILREKCPFIW